MKTQGRLAALCAAVVWAVFGASSIAGAQSAESFYKGKTITAVTEFGADAAITILSRVSAPHFAKQTGTKVLVKPMPGGGGTLARNFLYEAKADGLTLNLTAHGPKILTSGLFKLQGVRYQWSKFTFIGKTVESNSCVIVGKTAAYKGPADLAGKKFNYGESSPFFGPLFAEALNWDKMTVIPGYRSTTGRAVAISRGELQAASASAQATVASPDLIRLLVCSFPSKGFPNVPRVAQGMAPGRKKWVDYIEGWNKAMYVTVAPPGVPADRARFLEKALERMWADPEYQKAIKKIRYNPSSQFISSAELKSFVESLVALKDDEVKDMRTVITKKYKKK